MTEIRKCPSWKETVNNFCERCGADVTIVPICSDRYPRTHALGGRIVPLKYHSSFDWLMEVVIKIESIAPSRVIIDCKTVRIVKPKGADIKVHTLVKINSLWQAIIKFINWYNETNTNGKT